MPAVAHRNPDTTYITLVVLYVIALAIAVSAAKKLVILPFGMSASAGTILGYGFCFVITDIISEVYGYKASRQALRYGLLMFIVLVGMMQFSLLLPTQDTWSDQQSYMDVFQTTPRMLLGGLLAYWLSQQVDVWVYHKLKHQTQGKMLWLRNNVSTLAGQLVDSMVWPTVIFAGVLSFSEIIAIVQGEYVVKAIIALLDTFIIYAVMMWVFNKVKAPKKAG